jgi:hypothetical protein
LILIFVWGLFLCLLLLIPLLLILFLWLMFLFLWFLFLIPQLLIPFLWLLLLIPRLLIPLMSHHSHQLHRFPDTVAAVAAVDQAHSHCFCTCAQHRPSWFVSWFFSEWL